MVIGSTKEALSVHSVNFRFEGRPANKSRTEPVSICWTGESDTPGAVLMVVFSIPYVEKSGEEVESAIIARDWECGSNAENDFGGCFHTRGIVSKIVGGRLKLEGRRIDGVERSKEQREIVGFIKTRT